ncbi:hypothetical protein CWO92_23280 [Heyndrickxia camelliae]|uniref:Uncharacterized protein n=2 Tax=Heyndrickxia camelliae TaxID=1707093 RepID=A0A2N3LDJ7_9BACI|nr:hypothetical protein CWO92_23280 [Heyndrickxia camelliae]
MEYLINLTYDPFICSLSVSLILTIGLACIWHKFRIQSYSYFSEGQTNIEISLESPLESANERIQNPIIKWILKYVRLKESAKDDSDHHLSVIQTTYIQTIGG